MALYDVPWHFARHEHPQARTTRQRHTERTHTQTHTYIHTLFTGTAMHSDFTSSPSSSPSSAPTQNETLLLLHYSSRLEAARAEMHTLLANIPTAPTPTPHTTLHPASPYASISNTLHSSPDSDLESLLPPSRHLRNYPLYDSLLSYLHKLPSSVPGLSCHA